MAKLWGGRFEKKTDREVEDYTSSLNVDIRLFAVDVRGSIAHARMLGETGIIQKTESEILIKGLEALLVDFEAGKLSFQPEAEDVHSEVERMLTERVGAVGGKLHTARSRNDQVTTDTRLYLREHVGALIEQIISLQTGLVKCSEQHVETILPGLTHMQHAQPVSLGHHLMAYFWMLERDRGRLEDAVKRANKMPLGSAALAGTSFPIDRNKVARELGFSGVTQNSLDTVADRDYVVESLSACALVMTHLSQFAQDLALWSTIEYGFVELDDEVTTGSSIMPQKKNPDVAELIRGKSARLIASVTGALALLKALPLSYNRDLQEDKTYLFEGLDLTLSSLRMAQKLLNGANFKVERMEKAVAGDYSNATDLADFLAAKGIPFRKCHEMTGEIVRSCIEQKRSLESLTVAELQKFSPLLDAHAQERLQPRSVLNARTSEGGTSPQMVRRQIQQARVCLARV